MMTQVLSKNMHIVYTLKRERPSVLRRIARFFVAALDAAKQTPYGLPPEMAARMYL